MEVEFVIGGKTCARMGKDAFLVFENGETFSLDMDEDARKVSLIGSSQFNHSPPTAVRDPASGSLTITIEDHEFRVLPSSHKWLFNPGSGILQNEKRVGTFWTTKVLDHIYLELYIDLSEPEMVLLTVLASQAPDPEETRNGENH